MIAVDVPMPPDVGRFIGALLGGVDALPARLLPELEYRDELERLARQLHGLALTGGCSEANDRPWKQEGGMP